MSFPRSLIAAVVLVLFVGILAVQCSRLAPAHAAPPPLVNGIIVQFTPTSAQVAQADWRPIYGQPGRYAIPADASKLGSALNAYTSRSDVILAEPNYVITLSDPAPDDIPGLILSTVNDPLASQEYALSRMNVYGAWDVSRGDGVVIAGVDTGVDCTHPDLQGKCYAGASFDPGAATPADNHGHGTHTAGTFAAVTNNSIGVSGVGYNAKILPVKVLSASGSGDHAAIASGIRWAADHGARVINLSLGGAYDSDTLRSAVSYAIGAHVVVVASAGNDGSRADLYPASYPGVISVCATDENDRKASFSNFASSVDVCAPGVGILSTTRGSGYGTMSGTSMAAPHVAGLAALVLAAHPSWGVSQVKAAIENGADAVVNVGHGRINAARAVGASTSPSPTVTPGPTPPPSSDDYASQVITGINNARAGYSLAPFTRVRALDNAADFHNRWMTDNGCFSHICTGEPDPFKRMRNAGYPLLTGSETIGAGYRTPQDMVNGWLNSPNHRAIVLGGLHDIGCGYLYSSSTQYGSYWTCDFGNSSDVVPSPTRAQPTATWTPIPRPTVPTPTPIGTPFLPSGWQMSIHFPYNRFTWTAIHNLYVQFCQGMARQGVWCTWERAPQGRDEG